MSGWSQLRRSTTSQEPQGADTSGSRGGRGAGTSNSAMMEKLFAERNYAILDRRATERAVQRNNAAHLADLPHILESFHLSPREAYDAEVVARLAEFQQNFFRRESVGKVDGIVGSKTLTLLSSYYDKKDAGEADTSGLWPPSGASTAAQYEHCARLATAFGNPPVQGEPLLIGIRGVMEFAKASHDIKHINSYDDTYVLLFKTDDGVGVWTFAGATHAYQAMSGASPNADDKGRGRAGGDVGSVRPTHDGEHYTLSPRGNYHGRKSLGVGSDPTEWGLDSKPSWWTLGNVPVERDANNDRRVSDAEAKASEERTTKNRSGHDPRRQVENGLGDYGSVTWFHPGYTEKKDSGRKFSSIACLTAREEDVNNLVDLAKVSKSDIRMIVVEAAEAARRMSQKATPKPRQ